MESIYEAQVDPESPNHAHGIALQLVGTGQRVLELGAAGGHVTRALKARGNTVTAVELDAQFEDTLSAAADEVLMTNLDWLDLSQKLIGQKFDVILAGDVLEHCVYPELVVFQFHELLADNGRLIVSLPNVAHGDVRLSLLAGVFKYSETGLLDRTHLRLFTRETIKAFFEASGFLVEKIFGSTTPIGTTEVGVPDAGIPVAAIEYVRNQRDASVYQYIMELRPDPLWQEVVVPEVEPVHEATTVQQLLAENGLLRSSLAHMREHSSVLRNEMKNDELVQQLEKTMVVQSEQLVVAENQLVLQSEQLVVAENQLVLQSERLAAAEKHVLQARDQIIGNTARQAELDHLLRIARMNNDKLRHELKSVYGSRTWKLGRIVMLPVRVLRKILRKLK
jgi:2-polyprenyl-3-methyl-5-hydroxy-6-metoxy-1,4-benzoquinol methylase/sulfur carrier protein ThiS